MCDQCRRRSEQEKRNERQALVVQRERTVNEEKQRPLEKRVDELDVEGDKDGKIEVEAAEKMGPEHEVWAGVTWPHAN
jgi:hypothetical protein